MKDNIYYKTMIQQYEEIKHQKPHLDKAGIYCIKIDGVIIYIGKASNLLKRILAHQVNTKLNLPEHKYDVFRGIIQQGYTLCFEVLEYVPNKKDLLVIEGKWIRKYVPIMNYQIPKEDGIHYTVNPIAKKASAEMVIEHVKQYNKGGQNTKTALN